MPRHEPDTLIAPERITKRNGSCFSVNGNTWRTPEGEVYEEGDEWEFCISEPWEKNKHLTVIVNGYHASMGQGAMEGFAFMLLDALGYNYDGIRKNDEEPLAPIGY